MMGADGYATALLFIGLTLGLVTSWVLLSNHPYDRCVEMYATPEDIGECVWILENENG